LISVLFVGAAFLAPAAQLPSASQLEISPLYGESIRQIVGDFLTMPPAVKERLKRSLKR
jgi:hypothetical protein